MQPKTKTFARIRAALAEEGAPADTETRREAEVVKQVRERDLGSEPRFPPPAPEPLAPASELSSPNLMNQESVDDIPDDDMMGDLALGLSSSFKQHAMKNSRGKTFWDTFSESSSMGGARTSPPPAAFLPRGSSPGMSEDTAMDSPSLAGPTGYYSVWVQSFFALMPHALGAPVGLTVHRALKEAAPRARASPRSRAESITNVDATTTSIPSASSAGP